MKRTDSRKAKGPGFPEPSDEAHPIPPRSRRKYRPKARRKASDESRAIVPLPMPRAEQHLPQKITAAEGFGMMFGSLLGGFLFGDFGPQGKERGSGAGTVLGATLGLIAGRHYDAKHRLKRTPNRRSDVIDVEVVEKPTKAP